MYFANMYLIVKEKKNFFKMPSKTLSTFHSFNKHQLLRLLLSATCTSTLVNIVPE